MRRRRSLNSIVGLVALGVIAVIGSLGACTRPGAQTPTASVTAAPAGTTTPNAQEGLTAGAVVLPRDPCELIAQATIEEVLGVTDPSVAELSGSYGCTYTVSAAGDEGSRVMQLVMAEQGAAASRPLVDTIAQLSLEMDCGLTSGGMTGSSQPSQSPTPLPPEFAALMDQPLADVFRMSSRLVRSRCELDAMYENYFEFPGLGDAAAYNEVLLLGVMKSHNLWVVTG